jgi:cytochrome c oxidase assembly protein subunit 15
MQRRGFTFIYGSALVLALIVVVLGAYVRLSDAGLGCPDWPGCYGHLGVPGSADEVSRANSNFPHRPVASAKAWKEMIHRYAAGGLGLLLLFGAFMSVRHRQVRRLSAQVPVLLVPLVVAQALLGMWTVTLLLKPLVVTAHLLGGMTILALVSWCLLQVTGSGAMTIRSSGPGVSAVVVALIVLFAQLFLGGWTSANYAALACPDLPLCQGSWWPEADFRQAFVLWRGLGIDYEFGVLDAPARTAIHLTHRLGAVLTFAVVGLIGFRAVCAGVTRTRVAGTLVLLALVIQVLLGISNVRLGLPLWSAVAHNAVAALLLMSLIGLLHSVSPAAASDYIET